MTDLTTTNGTHPSDAAPEPDSLDVIAECLDDEFLMLDADIDAARRQIDRATQDLAEGIVKLAFALLQMQQSKAYERAEYPSFAAYVQQRHRLQPETAQKYITALAQLGQAGCRKLFLDAGAQRMFLVAQIRQLAPTLGDDLLQPLESGRPIVTRIPLGELETALGRVKDELAQAQQRTQVVESQLAAQDQNMARLRTVVDQVEAVNREVGEAHDRLEYQLKKEQDQHTRTRQEASKQRQSLEQTLAELRAQLTRRDTAPEAARPSLPAPPATTVEVIEVKQLVPTDPTLVADLLQTCAEALGRLPVPEELGEAADQTVQDAITALVGAIRQRYPVGGAP